VPGEDALPGRRYEESTDFKWTEKAFMTLDKGKLHGEVIVSRGIVRSRVWGPCPACEHDLDDRQTHTAVTGIFGGEWRDTARVDGGSRAGTPAYYQVDVSCGCGHAHPGAPAERTGCGASFRVELLVRTDEGSDQA
jgi:hypothetical protein